VVALKPQLRKKRTQALFRSRNAVVALKQAHVHARVCLDMRKQERRGGIETLLGVRGEPTGVQKQERRGGIETNS